MHILQISKNSSRSNQLEVVKISKILTELYNITYISISNSESQKY